MTPSPVIFIHGFADLSRSWRMIDPFLKTKGYRVLFFDYPTFRNAPDIPGLAIGLAQFVNRHLRGESFSILAHSQGGLIAEWFDFFHDSEERIRRIVTIATPFQGSFLPLLPPRVWMDHSPAGRNQLKNLATFSPVLRSLIDRRMNQPSSTPYYGFAGLLGRIFDLQGDRVVTAPESNRNAVFYVMKDGSAEKRDSEVCGPPTILRRNHWPISYLRGLRRNDNVFAKSLLDALMGRSPNAPNQATPLQAALVFPKYLLPPSKGRDEWPILTIRRTAHPDYVLAFLHSPGTTTLRISGNNIALHPGQFTYLLGSDWMQA